MASNEEIIDYVMESPDNTNPNVLRSMLGSGGGSYTLPVASADTLGGVKVGSGLSIADGVLSASGGGSVVLIVGATIVESSLVLDKTWQEINNADFAVIKLSMAENSISRVVVSETVIADANTYAVNTYSGSELLAFIATSADGYPTLSMGG